MKRKISPAPDFMTAPASVVGRPDWSSTLPAIFERCGLEVSRNANRRAKASATTIGYAVVGVALAAIWYVPRTLDTDRAERTQDVRFRSERLRRVVPPLNRSHVDGRRLR